MKIDFLLDYDVVTVASEQKLYLLARLIAGPAPDSGQRRPLNLSLVIDRSGSMAGSKIDYTRQAAQMLVQNMSSNDTLSVVLYNENVETLLPPQQVQHKDLINQRIKQIKAGGTTNLSGGWLEGVKWVAEQLQPEVVNRVILMSDGLTNRGITSPEKLIELARQKREGGVTTTTMGLGEDFNEDLLISMADAGGGAFYFIESPEVTPGIFQEELKGLLSLVGQNLSIQVIPTNDVTTVRQLNNYPSEVKGAGTLFRLGDVFGEEIKSLMLELHIPALQSIGQVEIAKLRFEYDEILAEERGTEHRTLELAVMVNVKSAAELPAGVAQQNKEVTRSVLLLSAAEARRQAIRMADGGQYNEAASVLRTAAEAIYTAKLDDQDLEEERGALITQAHDMDLGASAYDSYSRKSMATQSYFTGHGSHANTKAFRVRESERKTGAESAPPAAPVEQAKHNAPSPTEIDARKTGIWEGNLPDIANLVANMSGQNPTVMRWGNQTFTLSGELIRIGRDDNNEIVLKATGVSRFHAQIQRQGSELILKDLSSTNGTHRAGKLLEQPYRLQVGDVIYFCDQRVTFE
ncbi:MAG: VWA domain-containing protein [Phototrophicaceae bacterium]|jgi:Ca-activated chloride channel family protein